MAVSLSRKRSNLKRQGLPGYCPSTYWNIQRDRRVESVAMQGVET